MRGKIKAVALLAASLAAAAQAAQVEIAWEDPEHFRDIEAGQESQKTFQGRVMAELEVAIRCSADRVLPQDYRMEIMVTDLDLAGDLRYFFLQFDQPVRVVTDLYFPSMEFRWTLYDGEGEEVRQGMENIRDMGFRYHGDYFVRNAPLGYECRMIEDWFEKTFADLPR